VRNTPILSHLTGRVEDIVVTPDGRHVGRLDHAFKDALNIKEAQIIQEDIQSILVKIVPRQGFTSNDERRIISGLRLRLGREINIHMQLVDSISRTSNGKFRFVISKIPLQIGKELSIRTSSVSEITSA
jgi:phenylacetate-CoA ligase